MKLVYCPECAAPLTKKSETAYICASGHPYWNNPRAAVSVALVRDGQILFSKRGRDPHRGKYDLPGGFADYGENAWQAAIRELQEEAGVMISDLTMIDSTNQPYEDTVTVCDVIFVTEHWQGNPSANDDVASLEWKPIAFLDSPEFAWDYAGLADKLYTQFNITKG